MLSNWLMRCVFVLLAYAGGPLWATLLGTSEMGLRLQGGFLAEASTAPIPTILVMGDSLSAGFGIDVKQGWVALMEARLKSQGYGYKVVNASASGETSAGARARLPKLFELYKPAILILEIGANDGLRGLPLKQTQENLNFMLDLAERTRAQTVLLGMQIPPNYGAKYTDSFYALFADQAKARKLSYVPFFLDGVALDAKLMQDDGLHPNATAQPRLLDNVWPALKPVLKKK